MVPEIRSALGMESKSSGYDDVKHRRQLLESYLDAELAAMLSTDDKITDTMQVLGADGCLARLKEFFGDQVLVVVDDQGFAPALLNLRQQVQQQAGPVVDIRGFEPALLALCQQIHRQAQPVRTAVPDQNDNKEVASSREDWPLSSGRYDYNYDHQLTLARYEHGQVIHLSHANRLVPNGGPSKMDTSMSVMVRINPRPLYGGTPFDRAVTFDTGADRAMVSQDLVYLFSTMETVSPSPVVTFNGQDLICTGLVEFSLEFAGSSCGVTAWVSPALRDTIILGYLTMLGLGFLRTPRAMRTRNEPAREPVEETYPGMGVTVNDPTRFAGEDATEDIPAGLMSPFHLGWKRVVVFRQAQPHKCEVYYITPKGKRIHSKKDIDQYFRVAPNNHLSSLNFS